MNYAKIKNVDIANGPGCRVSLFVSGCTNRCPGCFNKETWDFNYGNKFDIQALCTIMDCLEPYYIRGLSVLGGEPFDNEEDVLWVLMSVKDKYPNKDIWLYTGYTYEEKKDSPLMDYIDILVDGRFEEDKKDITLQFKGSTNQRIIDIPKTRETGKIVLW